MLTLHPKEPRKVVRVLAEIEAGEHLWTLAHRRGLAVKGIYVRLVGWLMVFAALFVGFSIRVMGRPLRRPRPAA
jgi:hypothetical protein